MGALFVRCLFLLRTIDTSYCDSVTVFLIFVLEKKYTAIYTPSGPMDIMLQNQNDENGALPLANAIGFILGFMGVIAFFIQQSLTVFLPLLMPPTVCFIFCTLLYKTQKKSQASTDKSTASPVRIDVI